MDRSVGKEFIDWICISRLPSGAWEVCEAYPRDDPRGVGGEEAIPPPQVPLCHAHCRRSRALHVQGQEGRSTGQ